ncbi:M48 family metallopeptidase [bacterium]|nr:M48 family metallopeptidase [bacterium]
MFFIKRFLLSRAIWLKKNIQKVIDNPTILGIKHSEADIKKYKQQARALVEERLNYFNQFYNLEVKRISIRNQKSRWGSCSSKKNLNFNYRLALLPAEIADYIIVHELCHLAEMNHSKAFWALVARTIPDYKNRQKLLKKI